MLNVDVAAAIRKNRLLAKKPARKKQQQRKKKTSGDDAGRRPKEARKGKRTDDKPEKKSNVRDKGKDDELNNPASQANMPGPRLFSLTDTVEEPDVPQTMQDRKIAEPAAVAAMMPPPP